MNEFSIHQYEKVLYRKNLCENSRKHDVFLVVQGTQMKQKTNWAGTVRRLLFRAKYRSSTWLNLNFLLFDLPVDGMVFTKSSMSLALPVRCTSQQTGESKCLQQ